MTHPFSDNALGALLASPPINLLRIAALCAAPDGAADAETLAQLHEQVERGVLEELEPLDAWPELARGLMLERPSRMLRCLRDCAALAELLPEVDALFGMPQADSRGDLVDLGEHLLAVADELARVGAPLPLRLAGLLYNLGKADSPPEHLPTHYQHVARGVPRIHAVCDRFDVDDAFRDLALLAVSELERLHKATESRAGALAAMLERLDAFARPQRFGQLLQLAAADFQAFPGAPAAYPKAAMLHAALAACLALEDSDADAEALQHARALAIAGALHSQRWSRDEAV